MGGPGRPGVAAFDFDGTLTRRDTLLPFLRRACGTWPVARAAVVAARRSRDRDAFKVLVIGRLFRGWPVERLDALGRGYVPHLRGALRPESQERLHWHRRQGHAVVIVSASLGAYLRPLAEHLELDDALAVELVSDAGGTLTGEVVGGLNTRGPEKVARLRGWIDARFGPGTDVELWAYGDSSGDDELLAAADHPTWIGRRARTPTFCPQNDQAATSAASARRRRPG
ncbi:MAG TPA: HAD-IB family hydrolase [Acidimicrobiales bacterium]|nr:HAD-IB family hydrolase [Acidimicrobiales bacterium]